MLKGAKLIDSISLVDLAQIYKIKGKDYRNNVILEEMSKKMSSIYSTEEESLELLNTIYSVIQYVDLYINSTPDDEILPFWYYTPNTKMPEELKGIYEDVRFPDTMPSSTVQQSSRVDPNIKNGHTNSNYYNERNTGRTHYVTRVNSRGGFSRN